MVQRAGTSTFPVTMTDPSFQIVARCRKIPTPSSFTVTDSGIQNLAYRSEIYAPLHTMTPQTGIQDMELGGPSITAPPFIMAATSDIQQMTYGSGMPTQGPVAAHSSSYDSYDLTPLPKMPATPNPYRPFRTMVPLGRDLASSTSLGVATTAFVDQTPPVTKAIATLRKEDDPKCIEFWMVQE
jgi:hypothetical protein